MAGIHRYNFARMGEKIMTRRSRIRIIALLTATAIGGQVMDSQKSVTSQELKKDPTPQDYVERNGGGASIVPAGQLVLDGRHISCGHWATVLDPNLNDYAAAPYRQFIILNMPYVAKVPTAVKLWIYNHECGHKFGGPDENKADCFAVRRGRAEGWLDASGLEQVCSFIGAARSDAMHVSGLDRCNLMRECWRQTGPKPTAKPVPLPVSKPSQ